MKDCCRRSAARYLKRHRDVAVCDACGFLLTAYGNDRDFEATIESLKAWGGEFGSDALGPLRIVAKARAGRRRGSG